LLAENLYTRCVPFPMVPVMPRLTYESTAPVVGLRLAIDARDTPPIVLNAPPTSRWLPWIRRV